MTNAQYFVLRRLHSLLGVFPLGIFLFNHLLTNSTGVLGAQFFEEKVALIHMLGPALPIVEALMIFIPLSIHIVLGIFIALQARYEKGGKTTKYARNWAYTFQRLTGWVALAFIVYHVLHLRFLHEDIAVKPFSVTLGEMFYNMPMAPLFLIGYLLGGLSVVFHFANGLCTFCMTWGITIGQTSQKYVAYGATAVGGLLTFMLLSSIGAFWNEGRIMADLKQNDPAGYEAYVVNLRKVHGYDPAAETAGQAQQQEMLDDRASLPLQNN